MTTEIKRYHFVYRITNTKLNKHYYGTRTTSKKKEQTPEYELGHIYFSSSTDTDFIQDQKNNPQVYKYKVIKTFNTREEAMAFEIKLHNKFNVGVNESFYNKAKATSTGFDVTGNKDIRRKITISNITTKNSEDWVANRRDEIALKISTSVEELWKNKEYRNHQKVIHKGTCTGLNHSNIKRIAIFNENDEWVFSVLYDIKGTMDKMGYPGSSFQQSLYRKQKLFQSERPQDIGKAKSRGIYHLKGWRASFIFD